MIQPNKISKSYSFCYCSLDEIDNREHRLCYFGPNCSYFQHDHLDLMLKRCLCLGFIFEADKICQPVSETDLFDYSQCVVLNYKKDAHWFPPFFSYWIEDPVIVSNTHVH